MYRVATIVGLRLDRADHALGIRHDLCRLLLCRRHVLDRVSDLLCTVQPDEH